MIWQRPSASRRQRSRDELARIGGMLESMERRATVERFEAASAQRRRGKIQLTVAIVASLTGLALLLWTLPPAPAIGDPGRIGVAVSGSDAGGDVEVVADFSAAIGTGGTFWVSLTRIEPAEAMGADTSAVFVFCGAVAHGLRVRELNRLPSSPLRKLPTSPVEYDSMLGARDDCTYTTVQWTGPQVFIRGATDARDVSVSGKRVRYAFPGVVTLPVAQPLDGQEARPLPRGTAVTTRLMNAPDDLETVDAAPQLSSRGNLTWQSTFKSADTPPPLVYSVSGTLSDRENLAQAALFAAGIAGGLAVTAALAAAELLLGGRKRRKSSP